MLLVSDARLSHAIGPTVLEEHDLCCTSSTELLPIEDAIEATSTEGAICSCITGSTNGYHEHTASPLPPPLNDWTFADIKVVISSKL